MLGVRIRVICVTSTLTCEAAAASAAARRGTRVHGDLVELQMIIQKPIECNVKSVRGGMLEAILENNRVGNDVACFQTRSWRGCHGTGDGGFD